MAAIVGSGDQLWLQNFAVNGPGDHRWRDRSTKF